MAGDYDEKRRKTNILLHSIYDFGMGVLWLGLGTFFLLYRRLGIDMNLDPVLTTIFGIAALLYGVFRIYRGYRKNY
ncbi:MAG TPA: hypothetical protein VGC95_09960 [Chitinophagaceae bacterium]|jgi:hypothetical protein